ncbi:hypothetical protein ABES02_29545 [Neobacillus pocheonensis]|uniref:hypothetical protein n=1 Tax=Neobacillus pocheonensis TaxID=363869 RepID=UPI003D2DEC62
MSAAEQLSIDFVYLLDNKQIKPSFAFEDGIKHYVKAGCYVEWTDENTGEPHRGTVIRTFSEFWNGSGRGPIWLKKAQVVRKGEKHTLFISKLKRLDNEVYPQSSNGVTLDLNRSTRKLTIRFDEQPSAAVIARLEAKKFRRKTADWLWIANHKPDREQLAHRLMVQNIKATDPQIRKIEMLLKERDAENLAYGLKGFVVNDTGQLLIERHQLHNQKIMLPYLIMDEWGCMENERKNKEIEYAMLMPFDISDIERNMKEREEQERIELQNIYASDKWKHFVAEMRQASYWVDQEIMYYWDPELLQVAMQDDDDLKYFYSYMCPADYSVLTQRDDGKLVVELSTEQYTYSFIAEHRPDGEYRKNFKCRPGTFEAVEFIGYKELNTNSPLEPQK